MRAIRCWLALVLAGCAPFALADAAAGKATYEKTCALCHAGGLAGAPRFGQAAEWAPRIKQGVPKLYNSALKGTPNGMPAKGGNLNLADADVKSAVDYMVAAAGGAKRAAPAVAKEAKAAEPKRAEAKAAEAKVTEAKAAEAKPTPAAVAAATTRDPNAFNRLLPAAGKRNAPPAEDGIHDPANAGTHALQPPRAAFDGMPPLNAGNRVNWVGSLAEQ